MKETKQRKKERQSVNKNDDRHPGIVIFGINPLENHPPIKIYLFTLLLTYLCKINKKWRKKPFRICFWKKRLKSN